MKMNRPQSRNKNPKQNLDNPSERPDPPKIKAGSRRLEPQETDTRSDHEKRLAEQKKLEDNLKRMEEKDKAAKKAKDKAENEARVQMFRELWSKGPGPKLRTGKKGELPPILGKPEGYHAASPKKKR